MNYIKFNFDKIISTVFIFNNMLYNTFLIIADYLKIEIKKINEFKNITSLLQFLVAYFISVAVIFNLTDKHPYIFIILLPLFGSILSGLLGRFLGTYGSMLITTVFMILCTFHVIVAFYNVGLVGSFIQITISPWISVDLFNADWALLFDSLSVTMLIVVTLVSTLVHLYSCGYMIEDPHVSRFMSYISLFTFFMIMLVTSNNFLQLFFGWEGVGLCSFLLISFWNTRIQANKAAIKAMIVNRVGDFGLLFAILVMFKLFKSIEFASIFSIVPIFYKKYFIFFGLNLGILPTICLLLFIGAMGKSAQVGLHTWLPDAMEGPTPVSALIHAATMVTAGVFLIIRCSPIFEYAPTILTLITFVGAITAFFSASIGLVQNDIKKVIAYSTCSQLGYMIFSCGLSGYNVSLFHLFNHAFFKALLFLSAGSIIHSLSNEQDLRKMGGLLKLMPYTYINFIVGSLALMGFPFLAGFYSKDVILEIAYAKYTLLGTFAHWLGIISAAFTAYYSFRLIFWIFFAKCSGFKKVYFKIHELPIILAVPLFILATCSISSGFLFKDLFIGLGTSFFQNTIFIKTENYILTDAEFIPSYIKLIPIYFSIESALLSVHISYYFKYLLFYWQQNKFYALFEFLSNKWHFDTVYNYFINETILYSSYHLTFKLIDKELVEFFSGAETISKIYKNFFDAFNKESLFYTNVSMQISSMLISALFFAITFQVYFFN